jgi:hypothetical protein
MRSANNAACQVRNSQAIEGASRQRAAPRSQFVGAAAGQRRQSIATHALASTRSNPTQASRIAALPPHPWSRPHKTRRALHSPPLILCIDAFRSGYTCHCTHRCNSQHTSRFGFAAVVNSRSCTRRFPRQSLAMVVCALPPATRSNPSVKPTRSGLRPPRAAYLKR